VAQVKRLEGKVALVTGASSGIGRGIVIRLVEDGAMVTAVDINAVAGEELARELRASHQAEIFFQAGDVSDPTFAAAVVQATADRFGRLDVLVNNAGVRERRTILDLLLEEWLRVLSVNLTGPMLLSQAAARIMKEQGGGRIVNIASIAGVVAVNHRPAYTASKHGLVGLTRSMAMDLGEFNICVNAIAPGIVETALTADYLQKPEVQESIKGVTPLRSWGKPRDIAAAVSFLASDDARFVSGIVLPVDGGFTGTKSYGAP
jgi:3-oxoacyl-[acyl-carrier protein] reductase